GGLGRIDGVDGVLGGLVDLAVLDDLPGAVVVVLGAAVAALALDAALVVGHGRLLCVAVRIERTGKPQVTTKVTAIWAPILPVDSRSARPDAADFDRRPQPECSSPWCRRAAWAVPPRRRAAPWRRGMPRPRRGPAASSRSSRSRRRPRARS